MKKLLLLSAVTFLLSACGSSLDGTYSDENGIMEYKFESSGKVYAGVMGMKTELEYEIDGDKLKIFVPGGGNQIMTLNDDGSISGPMGVKLTKQE